MAHSDHRRNTYSSHFFFFFKEWKGCFTLLTVMALTQFVMGTVKPLSIDRHRQEGSRKLAAWAQEPF